MNPEKHLEAIAVHRKAIFEYFRIKCPYYEDIDNLTDERWSVYGTDTVCWSGEMPENGEEYTYSEEILNNSVHVGSEFTLIRVHLSTGDNGLMLFDNSKRVEDA